MEHIMALGGWKIVYSAELKEIVSLQSDEDRGWVKDLMEKHVGVRSPSEVVDLLWEWGIEINTETIKKRAN